MLAMRQAGFVLGAYAVSLTAIVLYTVSLLARARRAARRLPGEERPWQ
jgi:hypothetical protein